MKIGIDTFGCDHARSGFGSYLISCIANIPTDLLDNFELFGSELDRYTYSSDRPIKFNSVSVLDSLVIERFWHLFKINKFLKKNKYDLVIYPAVERVIPIRFKTKGVAIVNSIISKQMESSSGIYKWQFKRGLKKISKIIAASNVIKEDLIKFGISAEKITVVHNGIEHKLFYPMVDLNEDEIQIHPFAIKRPYFIYGSNINGPEKKHEELIKAFELFKKRTGLPHRLVITGSEGNYFNYISDLAFNSEYSTDIFITGYFPHENLGKLYAGAEACVFPAVNEGVGLPILEAMASGIPVLCSNSGALQEMGGDSPIYFDSNNIEEIATAMQLVVEDEEKRKSMIEKGLERASNFSWDKTDLETLKSIGVDL
ncbi:MAG: glycosyltransferase family 4 protein [Treponema sp.]|nr:glycosyltransferase family 4 protein [Treponema sp.]